MILAVLAGDRVSPIDGVEALVDLNSPVSAGDAVDM
jgi:hypothetical protein